MNPLSPRFRFGLRFVMLSRQWRHTLNLRLAEIGFSDAAWAPLVHLEAFGDGISQKELAERLGLDGSSLVRTLDILGRDGQIERLPDPVDRRARRIMLTEKGKRSVVEIRKVLVAAETEMLADFDDDEIEALLDAFDKIDGRLKK
ncbi:MarR family transcriptional regulator [Martelella alba]|uniref:MarR family transcriptional regulator n=1 Tax=Martelella alba TaxID=2590451 RepID=A0A506UC20_9HYPH|nr:MarR family transcriptional regulator [Martelella alba]TPW30524.1 MarR family transcriptional regulator [Martelella alba]